MTISQPTETFDGREVETYEGGDVASRDGVVHRLALDYDDGRSMVELLEEYLGKVDKSRVEALILGMWSEPHDSGPGDALDLLVTRAQELPNLRALFVGDMTFEQCEISWIIQGNYAALLAAYPKLQVLRIRGSTSLELPAFRHASLRQLVIECGGMPSEIAEGLATSDLPALEKLELWLGTSDYGFTGGVSLYKHVMDNLRRGGKLRELGLRDAEIADDLAFWLADEAWVARLEVLDLSLGTLSDEGAKALLANPQHLRALKRLDLSHHYIGDALQQQLRAAIPCVVLDDPQEADEGKYRYVAVGE